MADKLDMLIALAAKDCGNDDVERWNNIDMSSDVVFSERFVRRMNRLLSKHKHSAQRLILRKVLVRVAVALMALMSLAFLTVMAIEPLREAIFQVVVEWYDDHLTIRYEKPQGDKPAMTTNAGYVIEGDAESESSFDEAESSGEEEAIVSAQDETAVLEGEAVSREEVTSVEEPDESQAATEVQTDPVVDVVTPPTIIEEVRKPTYIPDGVVEDVLMESPLGVYIDYYLGNDWVCSFMQDVWKETDIGLDNVGVSVQSIMVNEYEALVVTSTDKLEKYLVWNDGQYMYRLSFVEDDMDEMVMIAESVSP